MRLFRSRSCRWRDSTKLGSTPGSLLFSTEAGDGEDKGWSRTQPSRAMTQSSPIPRLRQASVRMTIIGLVCHETPHCARNFMILTTRDQGNQKKELNLVTNTCRSWQTITSLRPISTGLMRLHSALNARSSHFIGRRHVSSYTEALS